MDQIRMGQITMFFNTEPWQSYINRKANWRPTKQQTEGQTVHGSPDLILLDENTLQIDLKTQWNPYQNLSWFLSTKWKADPKILKVNARDPEQPKQFWKRRTRLEDSHFMTWKLTTKLH